MELRIPAELDEFRRQVRTFIAAKLPLAIARRQKEGWHATEEDLRCWFQILAEKGWSVPDWPEKYGGPGWSPLQSYVFEDECAAADAPHISWRAGIGLVGPVIYTFGSAAQKARYLPRIRSGEEFWCQGFSEPNAGSDLASLRTTAVLDGDHFIVNGQKLWTSEAHFANLMFALVRTDPAAKPQRGISCLVIDMKSPGLTVRPILTIDNSHHINEVFFSDVRVPAENLVGELHAGWTAAKFLLGNERHSNALVQRVKREILKLRELAADPEFGERFIDNPNFRRKLAQLEIETRALEWAVLRAACAHTNAASPRDMAFTSGLKIVGSELQQRVADLQIDILGPWGQVDLPEPRKGAWAREDHPAEIPDSVPGTMTKALFRRASTIYGGANEIQRDIIWRTAFAHK